MYLFTRFSQDIKTNNLMMRNNMSKVVGDYHFNDKLLQESQKTIDKWYNSYVELDKPKLISDEILYPLYDDLNTPKFLGEIFEKMNTLNSLSEEGDKNIKE